MGKPRAIFLVRHAQSEGNKNRDIHQMIPDHRVQLTPEGWQQAEEAGRRLRGMLKPDDTLQFFTSPYRRTRETTEGILRTLTSSDPSEPAGPSPFQRQNIKVFEEPRLREQDFGNFQPCSTEMERMWKERADYGHFFYRIPNGESAADAYDRVSGFNESLWRSFSEDDFPSVCVLVTHGLMTRVFLMKWYHWSVEYFEDLRNVNHCEFVTMTRSPLNGRYLLENKLRTWSELRRKAVMTAAAENKPASSQSPVIPTRKWGGCVNGCTHKHDNRPRRVRRGNTQDQFSLPPAVQIPDAEKEDHPVAVQEVTESTTGTLIPKPATTHIPSKATLPPSSTVDLPLRPSMVTMNSGRDFGGSHSGAGTPGEGISEESDYFPALPAHSLGSKPKPKKKPKRQPTEENLESWAKQSGMGIGARADALGDKSDSEGSVSDEVGGTGQTQQDFRNKVVAEVQKVEQEEARDKSFRGSVL
ncbi:hypothetical protein LTR66_001745 [Elasticomyces elasticus]|nr:hypothetical protein LTR66_001745 [Elasticomyces elasticus]